MKSGGGPHPDFIRATHLGGSLLTRTKEAVRGRRSERPSLTRNRNLSPRCASGRRPRSSWSFLRLFSSAPLLGFAVPALLFFWAVGSPPGRRSELAVERLA